MASRVLLVRSGSVLAKGRASGCTTTPPLGIAYLAACVRQRGHDVSAIDGVGEAPTRETIGKDFDILGLTNEEVIEVARSRNVDFDIIGFSCLFSNEWIYLRELISLFKKTFPNAITVLGGEHASALPDYSLRSCSELDYVLAGEGEQVFMDFVDQIDRGEFKPELLGNLSYRSKDGIKTNPKIARIKDVDTIPWPAWDLLPVENYLKEGIATITNKDQRVIPLLASRGCPFACKFCSNPGHTGNNYYTRDHLDVIAEIKFYKQHYGITGFELHDLTFITNRNWIKKFCRSLMDENLNLTWNVPTTRSEAIDDEVVELLKNTGCRNLCLTPDSGSPRMLKEMLKKVNLERITNTAKTILRSGIILKVNIVFGFPGETHYDIWRSILYGMKLSSLGVDSIFFYRFVPYPGSEYHKLLKARGKLPPEGPEFDQFLVGNICNELGQMTSWSEHVSDRMIKFYMFSAYILAQLTYFLFRPWKFPIVFYRVLINRPEAHTDILIRVALEKMFAMPVKMFRKILPASSEPGLAK